jgi:hypothetical protein
MVAPVQPNSGTSGSGSGTASGTAPSTTNTNLGSQAYLVPCFTGIDDVIVEQFLDAAPIHQSSKDGYLIKH